MIEHLDRSLSVACFGLVGDGDGRVLLVRQSYGLRLWALPGGMALPGEDLTETARREVFEETGIEASMGDLIAVADRGTLLVVVFQVTAPTTQTTAQAGEIDECRWFTATELKALGDRAYADAIHLGIAWADQPREGLKLTSLSTPVGNHVIHSAYASGIRPCSATPLESDFPPHEAESPSPDRDSSPGS